MAQMRAKEKARDTVTLKDVNQYRHSGVIPESMRGLCVLANQELQDWIADLGGKDNVSSQELAVLQDASRVGIAMKALLVQFLGSEGKNRAVAATMGSLAAVRRSCLEAVGLERRAKELDLEGYIQQASG